MIVVIDADYNEEQKRGHVAGIVAENIYAKKEDRVVTAIVDNVGEYIPGQFYKRELKSVKAIISKLNIEDIELIVVDGYADSGTKEHALGTFVFEEYNIPVIGVAKNRYGKCTIENIEVYRGQSEKPLFVTSKGIDNEKAKEYIKNMAGEYRLPYLIKYADNRARDWAE